MKKLRRAPILYVVLAAGLVAFLLTPWGVAAARRIYGHRIFTIPMLLLAISVGALVWRRKYRMALVGCAVAMALTIGYGSQIFQRKYPHNVLLEVETLPKAWRLISGQDILLGDFRPMPALKVENREVARARFPVIDVHFHLYQAAVDHGVAPADLIAAMDALGIDRIVSVDGRPHQFEYLKTELVDRYPGRFMLFATLDPREMFEPGFPEKQLKWLEQAAALGARGIKVHKRLGLTVRDSAGQLVRIDDPRLAPLWNKAAELALPVLMHVTDPTPFFSLVDATNERYEELVAFPGWSFYGPSFPSKDSLLAQRENVLRRHPRTVFIGAHFGDNPEDLAYVETMLERYPNYHVEISSRVPELGRQPYSARRFFVKYQDRILFGSDGGYGLDTPEWHPIRFYRTYFEFLETQNEYIEYPLHGLQPQGRWRVYGIHLPDSVLKKVYYENSERILPRGAPERRRPSELDEK